MTTYTTDQIVAALWVARAYLPVSSHVKPTDEILRSLAESYPKLVEYAERYRWWRDNYGCEYDGPETFKLYALVSTNNVKTHDQFDAAIDAARNKP